MIIPKIKCNFTPLLMADIIGHFQICNSILLGCFNWPFMIMAKVIRSRSDVAELNKMLISELPRY
jgi:hypothetical protein